MLSMAEWGGIECMSTITSLQVQLFVTAGSGWTVTAGYIIRCGIISSCQSAAANEIVNRRWSWVVVDDTDDVP